MEKNIPYDLLEEYIKGTLSGDELIAFEEQLNNDEHLQKELELYKEIRNAQIDSRLTAFEKRLEAVNEDFFEKEKTNTTSKGSRVWLWVIGGILLLGLAYLANNFLTTPKKIEPQKIYAEYAQHNFSFQEMSDETALLEIQNALQNENYQEAIPIIENYLTTHPNVAEIKLAKGIALLETENFSLAQKSFEDLGQAHPIYKSESLWYLGLTNLKKGDLQISTSYLSQIPKNSSRYSDAQTLISELEK